LVRRELLIDCIQTNNRYICPAKITGKEGTRFSGPAKVFDEESDMIAALEAKQINKGDVIVIRYQGPKGGPGMPEMRTIFILHIFNLILQIIHT
jgi:dihydroxyacid dehydratase/phosphogluconate dehydratase